MSQEYKMVPVTPTAEMLLAVGGRVTVDVWNAMLAASPVPPAGGPHVFDAIRDLLEPECGKQNMEFGETIARLQAEVESCKARCSRRVEDIQLQAQRHEQTQSELTKARELLSKVIDGTGTSPGANKRYGKIRAYLDGLPTCKTCKGTGKEYDGAAHTCTVCNGSGIARQSAPAAKGGE